MNQQEDGDLQDRVVSLKEENRKLRMEAEIAEKTGTVLGLRLNFKLLF